MAMAAMRLLSATRRLARRVPRRQFSFTSAAIAASDDAALRKFINDPSFLAAVDGDAALGGAFAARVEAAHVEVSRIGEPQRDKGGPEVYAYSVHLFAGDDGPAHLGTTRAALWRGQDNAMIFQAAPRAASVPTHVMATLAKTVAVEMAAFGAERVAAIARPAGLCAWIAATRAWEAYDEPGRGAVEAVALNRPRPGHSVLGKGTFRDAESPFTELALGFAGRDETGECAAYRGAGFALAGANWLHDASPEALADFGGVTIAFHFESEASWNESD